MTEVFGIIIGVAFLAIVVVALVGTAKIVPQRSAFVVERLGKYSRTLDAGFHILIPFIDIEEDFEDFKGLIEDIWDLWCEEGKARERVGEFIQRIGMGNFLDAIGLDPEAEMVAHPRENPYVFYDQGGDDDDENDDD